MSTLTERDQLIAILAAQGTSNKEIACQVGVHYNTVGRILQRFEVQDFIAEPRQEIQAQMVEKVAKTLAERMDDATEDAFDALTSLMQVAKSESVQLKAIESVPDRSKVAPKREIHSRSTVEEERRDIRIVIDAEMIKQLKMGLYDPRDLEEAIGVTLMPHPLRPMREVLAELEAAEAELEAEAQEATGG